MAQIYVIGRITAEPELKTSQKNTPYMRFNLAENIGGKDRTRTQYYQVWAWNEDAERLANAGVKKGSLIFIVGNLELETYTKQDGVTIDKRLRVSLNDWGFIPIGNRANKNAQKSKHTESNNVLPAPSIDGDKEILP